MNMRKKSAAGEESFGGGIGKTIIGKKGAAGDMLAVFPFFFIMIGLIGGGIVVGVLLFYGNGYDSRGVESDLLTHQIRECILESKDVEGLLLGGEFFTRCRINEEIVGEHFQLRVCESNQEKCLIGDGALLSKGKDIRTCGFTGECSLEFFWECECVGVCEGSVFC